MSSQGFNVGEEIAKDLIGEATTLLLPGVRTALRFVVIQTQDGDVIAGALREALQYRFAPLETSADSSQNDGVRFARHPIRWQRRRKAQKTAVKEVQKMAAEHGFDVPTLLAATADSGPEEVLEILPARRHSALDGALAPLQLVRNELALATKPLMPPAQGWRQHVAAILTTTARTGIESPDEERRKHWEKILGDSLGISSNFVERAPDWGRLVAAAVDYEIRKKEQNQMALSMLLDRADATAQFEDLVHTAGVARRSLSALTFWVGVLAVTAVAATVLFAISLVT